MSHLADGTHRRFLETTTVGSLLVDDRKLFFISPTTTIAEATKVFREKNVLALPIWDERTNTWDGFIDLFALMTYVAFGRPEILKKGQDFWTNFNFSDQPVGPLTLVSRTAQKMFVFPATQNLFTIIETLALSTPRVLIQSPHPGADPLEKAPISLFTQTDAVQFLSKNLDKMGPIVDQYISELGLIDDTPVTLNEAETALEGFRTIRLMCISAVAVVNDSGEIITTLSASDVKGLTQETLPTIQKPVVEFLKARHPEGKLVHPVTCEARTLLKDVILQMVTAKVHRVFVVDASRKPRGVVSMTDICRVFTKW